MRANEANGSGNQHPNENPQQPLIAQRLRQCRYCYSEDDDGAQWMTPCRCTGSMGYVHSTCFSHWLDVAPYKQQFQCTTCNHFYQKTWNLKGIRKWCLPRLDIRLWDTVEIMLDIYSTFKLISGFFHLATGRRSLLGQLAYFLFWKTFILTEQRSMFYKGIGRALAQTVCMEVVQDVEPLEIEEEASESESDDDSD